MVQVHGCGLITCTITTSLLVQASYRTTIFVANQTLGNPKVATLAANLTIVGQVRTPCAAASHRTYYLLLILPSLMPNLNPSLYLARQHTGRVGQYRGEQRLGHARG